MAAHPKPEPDFWDERWSELSSRWVTELYVTARLAREGAMAAARNEVGYLNKTLVAINVHAQRPYRRRPEESRNTIQILLLEGLNFALEQAEVTTTSERARVAEVFAHVVTDTATEASLHRLTATLARRWRREDPAARRLRFWQTSPVMVFGTAAAVVTAREHGLHLWTFAAGATATLSPMLANTFFGERLPLTRRFRWRNNHIADAVMTCARALAGNRDAAASRSVGPAVKCSPGPTAFESAWVRARERGDIPAALGLAPEKLPPFKAARPPRFFDPQWAGYADDLTRGMYTSMVLARAGLARAAHLESRRALCTMGLLNVRAQEAYRQQPDPCRQVLEEIFRHAVSSAVAEVPARTPDEAMRIRTVIEYLSTRGQSNRALWLATKAARARWASSAAAEDARRVQSLIVISMAGALEWALLSSTHSYQIIIHALVWGVAATFLALGAQHFPHTSDFDWSTNHVSGAAKACTDFLGTVPDLTDRRS